MADKMCEYCAGSYDDMLPECPYCGSTNYKGAEAKYLKELEDVRKDLEELESVPKEETKKEMHKQSRFLIAVFAIIVVVIVALVVFRLLRFADWGYERDSKEDYLWKQKNYPVMNEIYESGDYAALDEFFASEKKNPTGAWEHSDFYYMYVNITELQKLYGWEEETELEPFDYAMILQKEWNVLSSLKDSRLDEQEREKLAGYEQMIQEKFDTRWNMSEADYKEFSRQVEENYGWISLDNCEAYVEKWLETKE